MIWIVVVAGLVLSFAIWQYKQRARRHLGRVGWQNQSASEAKLVRRVGKATAERLINSTLLNNPGQSRAWCADKALYDLNRDQRSY